VPGSAGFGAGLGWLGPDRVAGVSVAIPLSIGGHDAGPLFPVDAPDRIVGPRAERWPGPPGLGLSGLPREPARPVGPRLGVLPEIPVHLGRTSVRDPAAPRPGRL